MAQRAYRQRKESTLEELRKRVSELTSGMELMNKAFLDCRDRLVASGLADSQMQSMEETAVRFESLMKCARNPVEGVDSNANVQSASRSSNNAGAEGDPSRQAAVGDPKNVSSWIDQTVVNAQAKAGNPNDIGMGYTMYLSDGPGNALPSIGTLTNFDAVSQAFAGSAQHSSQTQGPSSSFDAFRVELPQTSSIPPTIDPPITYSFDESTFARRLHRSCLEQAYQLLLDPHKRPATYNRVFKLSLMVKDRNSLIVAMKALLSRSISEDLDASATLIHVGGAGTHYPRKEANGIVRPKKDAWNLGMVGPKTLALLENAAAQNLTADMTVDIAGFEGEWLDPYDVEGYLNEKGIYIDGNSSFAEAEVIPNPPLKDNPSFPSASSEQVLRNTFGDTSSSLSDPPRAFDAEQLEYLSRSHVSTDELNEFQAVNMTDVGYSDTGTGSWMNFLQPGEATRQHATPGPAQLEDLLWEGSAGSLRDPMAQQRPGGMSKKASSVMKKVIIVDVAKFVKGEIQSTSARENE